MKDAKHCGISHTNQQQPQADYIGEPAHHLLYCSFHHLSRLCYHGDAGHTIQEKGCHVVTIFTVVTSLSESLYHLTCWG